MRQFAVSGMGRSGTKFLATALNCSPSWRVEHEPDGEELDVRRIRRRFLEAGDSYGEVNSYLRWSLLDLRVTWRAVIVRDPLELFQSICNMGMPHLLGHLNESLVAIDRLLMSGVESISFQDMTSGEQGILDVAKRCGVVDLEEGGAWKSLVGRKVNTAPAVYVPRKLRDEAEDLLAWFEEKHYRLF